MTTPAQIWLTWKDPLTHTVETTAFTLPVAIGRDPQSLPTTTPSGQTIAHLVLSSSRVSRYHAVIDYQSGELWINDLNSSNGLYVNNQRQARSPLGHQDIIRISPYEITISTTAPTQSSTHSGSKESIIQVPGTKLEDPEPAAAPNGASVKSLFPPAEFQKHFVDPQALYATQLPVEEIEYTTIGAGLGSYIWTDFLRIYGVPSDKIRALGLESVPYARYKRLCINSQIPAHERLRSNSDSCPDNIWGWPSYALREAYSDLLQGQFKAAFRYLWQVFGEPTLVETYTPRSGRVFQSIDREAKRIGWSQIYRFGRVRAIRKTSDGRYAIAYSQGQGRHAFVISHYVHLCTGYPVLQFLPDLQEYREKTNDFKSVVNAYEGHDQVYQSLEKSGGVVLIRGRGIVASRVIQRIYEARTRNPNISILHLMRSPKPKGNKFGKAEREVSNHFELQPFNWPKACWGGTLRESLEQAPPPERTHLIADWGGTTTAERQDWQDIIQAGLDQGWYQIVFGDVISVEQDAEGHPLTHIRKKGIDGELTLNAHFIIDATGLDGKVKSSPLLNDLVTHYQLPLNSIGRLTVTNEFELAMMRNSSGRMYAAGAITFGGPYAAVDSFLGLQYCALKALEDLLKHRAREVNAIRPLGSLLQWLKWVTNKAP